MSASLADPNAALVTTPAGATPQASFTRPADTTAYASGDLVANCVTAGSVAPIAIEAARVRGGAARILAARLAKSGSSLTNASFRVHLMTALPAVTNGDNGALAITPPEGVTESGAASIAVGVIMAGPKKPTPRQWLDGVLSLERQAAIYLAAQGTQLAFVLWRLGAAAEVDVTLQETIEGVTALAQAGLITEAEKAALLAS